MHIRIVRDVVTLEEAFAPSIQMDSQQCEPSGYNPILGTLLFCSVSMNICVAIAMLRVPLYRGVMMHVLRTMFANTARAITNFALRHDRQPDISVIREVSEVVLPVNDLLDIQSGQVESSAATRPHIATALDEGSSVRLSVEIVPQSPSVNTNDTFLREDCAILATVDDVM